jgi:hypothetical protein
MDWNPRTNGTLRGVLIIVAAAVVITAAGQAGSLGLGLVLTILRIAFVVVVGIFLYRLWRTYRGEIGLWPLRSRIVFYGAGLVALVDLVGAWLLAAYPVGGLEALVFFGVLAGCGFAMFRVWRDEHTYGY